MLMFFTIYVLILNEYEELRLLKGKALKEFKGLVQGVPDIVLSGTTEVSYRQI